MGAKLTKAYTSRQILQKIAGLPRRFSIENSKPHLDKDVRRNNIEKITIAPRTENTGCMDERLFPEA